MDSPKPKGGTLVYETVQTCDDESRIVPEHAASKLKETSLQSAADCRAFLRKNCAASTAVIAAILCCLVVTAYSHWLSKQILVCPDWAIQCTTSKFLRMNATNLAIIQGIASIAYSIGLPATAYGTKCVAESAIWPLLSQQYFSIDEINTYLSAARGSVPSTAMSWRMVSTKNTALVLLLSAITTLTPLVAAPLVGIVFARGNVSMDFQSNYTVANGIGRIYVETNPPVAVGAVSQVSYVSWSLGLSPEPLPIYRHWVIDRSALFARGNMSVRAVKAEIEITCQGTNITEISSTNSTAMSSTRMAEHTWRQMNSSDHVQVQLGKAVTVWVHDFSFDNANKSSADLVLAAFNGSMAGGTETTLSNGWTVSAIICKVGVEFVDKDLDIGDSPPSTTIRPVLSSNEKTAVPGKGENATGPTTLNENALWFAVAPLLVTTCVNGSQPLFYRSDNMSLPAAYTRAPYASHVEPEYSWSSADVKHFIETAVGAVAQASSMNNANGSTIITSRASTRKLHEGRAVYLTLPMLVIVAGQAVLLYWSAHMHRTEQLPIMRMASVSEILKSAQTDFFVDMARNNHQPGEESHLGKVNVKFGWTCSEGREVAGLGSDVFPFRHGCISSRS
ncbi:hypothetical protein H2200_002602 [Cladophialophora chaetospira]|uniref:Uncharacterized protein n=1 Tax=Cladophialophora chaetospira TaxID=386627 RepID=A0AA39CNQ4_9EURO|nr:hypothetical protein H2200_002602 [Cladophialophora chaetospira]